MLSRAPPDDPLEREYQSLMRKLRAGRGFCFIVYFVEDQRASHFLKNRLRAGLSEAHAELIEIAAVDAQALVATTLPQIFEAAARTLEGGPRNPCWVEAFREPGDRAWEAQRTELLMRMNERRSRLEAELLAPLILLLPAGAHRDVATLAPDLWHVRLHSAMLTMHGSELEPPAKNVDPGAPRLESLSPASVTPTADAPGVIPREVAYWRSLLDAAQRDGEDADSTAVDNLPLWDGFAAVDAWLEAGDTRQAVTLSATLLDIARGRWDRRAALEEAESPQARLELVAALVAHGDALRAAGDLHAAVASYQAAIDLTRAMHTDPQDADQPPITRGLLLQLQKLGDALLELGRPTEAAVAYRDSLQLARWLHARFGAEQEMRDLAQALEQVGDVGSYVGSPEEAHASYREALGLRRLLLRAGADDPQDLRALASSLNRVGYAERELGQGEAARAAFRECLELTRQLHARFPDDPSSARDLSIALNHLADAELDVADLAAALALNQEALELRRELVRAMPHGATALRDLSISLDKLGDIERTAGRPDAAVAAYRESLELGRRLAEQLGQGPQQLRDLAVTLIKLGDAEADAGRPEQALAAYQESLALSRRLHDAQGDSMQFVDDLAVVLERIARSPQLGVEARAEAAREAVALREQLVATQPASRRQRDRLAIASQIMSELAAGEAEPK